MKDAESAGPAKAKRRNRFVDNKSRNPLDAPNKILEEEPRRVVAAKNF